MREEFQRDEEILTLKEASQLLKISKSTLYNLVQRGEVPACRVGRSWRFVKINLIRWLEGRES